jgi:hypothetical protein
MSLPLITNEQFATVYMTTRLNDARLADMPPLNVTEIPSEMRRLYKDEGTAMTARWWDVYRDVVQLSFYYNGEYHHFLLCEEHPSESTSRLKSHVHIYDDEEALIKGAFEFLRGFFGPATASGAPLYTRLLIGWRMHIEIWPVLVNRAIKYRIPLYREMLTNPDSKWPTIRHLGDVASLYLQGGGVLRRLPGLPDLLRFWGFWGEDEHIPLPEDLEAAVCTDPYGVIKHVEKYLTAMHDVMCVYYQHNTDTQVDTPLNAGLAVPAILPSGPPPIG